MDAEEHRRRMDLKFRATAWFYDLFRLPFLFDPRGDPRQAAGRRAPDEARRILDVASGTGEAAIALARSHPQAEVLGIDITPSMLAIAKRKAAKAGLRNLTFQWMDASAMDLPDASFDAVTITFALHEMPAGVREPAIGQIARVLRPGGTLILVDLARPEGRRARVLFSLYLALFEPSHMDEFLDIDWPGALAALGLEVVAEERYLASRMFIAR